MEEPKGDVEADAVERLTSTFDGRYFRDGDGGLDSHWSPTNREVPAFVEKRDAAFAEDRPGVLSDPLCHEEFVASDCIRETPSKRLTHALGPTYLERLLLNHDTRRRSGDTTTQSELLAAGLQTPHRGAEPLSPPAVPRVRPTNQHHSRQREKPAMTARPTQDRDAHLAELTELALNINLDTVTDAEWKHSRGALRVSSAAVNTNPVATAVFNRTTARMNSAPR